MEKEHLIMERRAADNKYLHRDFHVTADIGISYVGEHFGDEGVKEYMVQYAKSFYSRLANEVKSVGLSAIDSYLHDIFRREEREDYIETKLTERELLVKIKRCPAIEFMKTEAGHTPSVWYGETTKTVYPVLAEMAGLGFELISYDEEWGAAEYRFFWEVK